MEWICTESECRREEAIIRVGNGIKWEVVFTWKCTTRSFLDKTSAMMMGKKKIETLSSFFCFTPPRYSTRAASSSDLCQLKLLHQQLFPPSLLMRKGAAFTKIVFLLISLCQVSKGESYHYCFLRDSSSGANRAAFSVGLQSYQDDW